MILKHEKSEISVPTNIVSGIKTQVLFVTVLCIITIMTYHYYHLRELECRVDNLNLVKSVSHNL